MAFRLPNNVLQLSATAGTADYTFTGAVSGYSAFSTQLGDGDTVPYFARDANAWEVGLGTWTAAGGTLARTLISSSTGSLISWPGTGSREVGCGLPGAWMLQMLDPSATPGFLVRGATLGTWLTRAFVAGSYIAISAPDGVSDNPGVDDSGLDISFPRIEALQTAIINAIWTFGSRIIFGGFAGGLPQYHELRGLTDELMFRWRRDGANDYDAELRQAASWRRLLTATAADLNDADRLQGLDSTQVPMASAAGYRYTTGLVEITSGGNGGGSFTHGLGAKPSLVHARLVCLNPEYGYNQGDTVEVGVLPSLGAGNNRGHSIIATSTHLSIRFGNGANVYQIPNATSGASENLTNANWSVELFAWR